MMDELTHADWSKLENHLAALYELRLTQVGPEGSEDDEDWKAKCWASAVLCEATCVLELRFGKEVAIAMLRAMLDRNEAHRGPRTRRARN